MKFKNLFQFKSLFPFLLVLAACNKENAPDCLQSAGDMTTETRLLPAFNIVEIRDYIQVELYDSTETFAQITAPENLLPEIIIQQENGELVISNQNSCNWVRSFKNRIVVRLYAPEFRHITQRGTGDITAINTLTCNSFTLENRHAAGTIQLKVIVDSLAILTHTGVADVTVSGVASHAEYFNQGYGWIDARDVEAQNVFVNNSSINNVYVNSTGYLYGAIYFSGNIYYGGHPTSIDKDIHGSGEFIELN
jgi:hypothetical protein